MHCFLYVCLSALVCETYVVHHLVGTGLRCAPPTCIVHHRPALCIMVHKGDLCMLVINSDSDGAQYDVVSLAVFLCLGLWEPGKGHRCQGQRSLNKGGWAHINVKLLHYFHIQMGK